MARTYRPATLPATRPDLQLAVASRDIGRAAKAAALQPKLARWLHRTETLRSAPNARRRAIRSLSPSARTKQKLSRTEYAPKPGAQSRDSPLFIQPPVFAAVGVVEAVDHQGHVLHVRVPAGMGAGVEDDRPGEFRGQFALDLPEDPLALFLIALARLLLDHLVDFGVAIAVPIEARAATVEQVESRRSEEHTSELQSRVD